MIESATIFISAFLLFLIQLILAKAFLPWFGGSASVWTTCMLFFQVLLLAGYGYSHLLDRRFTPRIQGRIHLAALLLAAAALAVQWNAWGGPLLPGDAWKPDPERAAAPHILLLLALAAGIPFFLLSTTSPLIQRWAAYRRPHHDAYRLYAYSNAGSLLALASYPFLIERHLDLPSQALLWVGLFAAFAAGLVRCAILPAQPPTAATCATTAPATPSTPAPARPLTWMLLAASTVAMFLAVTHQISEEIAVVPFLWVLPLGIYLLSFILCFSAGRWYRREWYLPLCVLSSIAVLAASYQGVGLGIIEQLLANGLFLFSFCMLVHGELAARKPGHESLTLFYLMVAVGGVVGGLFIAVAAPLLFVGYWEFHVTLAAAWLGLAILFARDAQSTFHRGSRIAFHATGLVVGGLCLHGLYYLLGPKDRPYVDLKAMLLAALAVAPLLALLHAALRKTSVMDHVAWPRAAVVAALIASEIFLGFRIQTSTRDATAMGRNFYGVVKIELTHDLEAGGHEVLRMKHGRIMHGLQFTEPRLRGVGTAYYATGTAAELAMRLHPRRTAEPAQPLHVGILGLGAGTLAVYGQPGDTMHLYELNPLVAAFAAGPDAPFTFLADTEADWTIALGDGRLMMERELREQGGQNFDVFVLDAFSSDAIPAHLVTREAIALYLQHLRDQDSVIAVHISNRFLDLRDLFYTLAAEAGLEAHHLPYEGDRSKGSSSAIWILLAQSPYWDEALADYRRPHTPRRKVLWTDRYSSLFEVLKSQN